MDDDHAYRAKDLLVDADTTGRLSRWSTVTSQVMTLLCALAAPIAPSGKAERHRLNRGGDRAANCALHMTAVVRLRCSQRAREYTTRRATRASPRQKSFAACGRRDGELVPALAVHSAMNLSMSVVDDDRAATLVGIEIDPDGTGGRTVGVPCRWRGGRAAPAAGWPRTHQVAGKAHRPCGRRSPARGCRPQIQRDVVQDAAAQVFGGAGQLGAGCPCRQSTACGARPCPGPGDGLGHLHLRAAGIPAHLHRQGRRRRARPRAPPERPATVRRAAQQPSTSTTGPS